MNDLEKEIQCCNKCGKLPKLTDVTLQKGKCNILVLGESPAKDGWIISKKPFYNKEGKLQASGKVLSKLLSLCGLTIEDISFTEVCKCIISNRKKLGECSKNCKPILFKQLNMLKFDIILTMGKYPTEIMLQKENLKLKDVVGKTFEISINGEIKTLIPIYHTSPLNPLCYKGNEEIFIKLKEYLKS